MTAVFCEDHAVRPIGICVDFDDTFTTNPPVWTAVIEYLRQHGANVFCITARFPNCPIPPEAFPGKIYYSSGQPKWEYAEENGIDVHIWIDDWPALIGDRSDRKGRLPPQFYMRQEMLKGEA